MYAQAMTLTVSKAGLGVAEVDLEEEVFPVLKVKMALQEEEDTGAIEGLETTNASDTTNQKLRIKTWKEETGSFKVIDNH